MFNLEFSKINAQLINVYRIVIIMRGVPGSGKSFISKMIKEKESEMQGSVRILSIDDYFMVDNDEYEYEASMEESYTQYLLKAFKKTLMDNLYQFVIIDCNNITLNHLNEFHTIATSCLFTVCIRFSTTTSRYLF